MNRHPGRPVRVVLVYVGAPDSEARPVLSPPIGVQLLGTLLLEHGAEVTLLDTRLTPEPKLLAEVDDIDPHLIGFSYLSPSAGDAVRLARTLRRPGRVLVAGGVHASIHTAATVRSGAFDCVVRREGERAILDLHDRVAAGLPVPEVVEGALWPDLDTLPPYADFDCYREIYADSATYRAVYLQLGRGCPMRCTFCELPNRAVFAPPRRRFRSIERVMAEVHTYVDRWGVNFVTVADPIATLDTPLITEFVRRMDAELPQVGFMFNGHVNRFRRDLAEELGRAQAHRRRDGQRITVWFGFESGSQRLLDFMKKGTTVEAGVAVGRLCREYDVQVGANLLLGLPTETDEDYAGHDAFLAAIEPTFPNPNILNPLPGTEMYDYCLAEGLLRNPDDYSIWRDTEIADRGEGPVRGVDYARVLAHYHRYRDLAAPSEPAEPAGMSGLTESSDSAGSSGAAGPSPSSGANAPVTGAPVTGDGAPRYRSWASATD